MSFDKLVTQSGTLKRLNNTLDRYNNIVEEYSTEDTITVRVDEQSTSEIDDDASSTNKVVKIFTRHQDINAHDIIEVGSNIYKVVGEPIIKRDGKGVIHHLEVAAELVIV
jgi:head-tail adaptor